jgi:cyclophilin family peptidyl-prolyl cis-trans isomerase
MLILALLLQAAATAPKSPPEIVAAAPLSEWVDIEPDHLLVMQLAPDREEKARQVIIQLIPSPFSQPWVANIRTLAKARWWDGTSVNRVQDNYVVQWGDATEKKALPAGVEKTSARDYRLAAPPELTTARKQGLEKALGDGVRIGDKEALERLVKQIWRFRDPYALSVGHFRGWPLAFDQTDMWPVHCYGMVGVGRNLAPDAGSGAELYTVIGHAPRHLDRNIALVGRVVEGIEHLSSLPRGTGSLGFYQDPAQRVPIVSIRLASDLAQAERPRLQYLSTEGATFDAFAEARANRRDAFFNVPAGGADICNIPVPIRRKP